MRVGFHCNGPNVEIFICPGDLEFSLTIPETRLRTPAGRAIVDHFLFGIATAPNIEVPYNEIEHLLDQLDVIFIPEK